MTEAVADTIPRRVFRHARVRGDHVAFHVVAGDVVTSITFDELVRRAAAYADRYRSSGVRAGDVVVISLRHGAALYPAFLGAMLAGAIPSFIPFPTPKQDPALYWEAHRILFGRVRPAAVLTYADNAADLAAVLPEESALLVDEPTPPVADESLDELAARLRLGEIDDIALLQHSSGTTGHKKGVMLTHRQIAIEVEAYTRAQGMTGEHRLVSWLPVYHDMGLISAFVGPLLIGATVVSMDAFEWVDHPHRVLELIDEYGCHFVWMPNFAYNHLVRTKEGTERYRLDHMVRFVCAAEPVKPEVFDRFVEAFAEHGVRAEQLGTAYGMAETVMAATMPPTGRAPTRTWFDATALRVGRAVTRGPGPGAIGYVSNGPVIDDIEIRVDPAADVPGDGIAVGELQFRGPYVFDGYFRNPEATADAMDDGWLRTGDLGFLLDGEAYVVGRKKDVIIHHGVNYYAHDLEALASSIPGVKPGRCAALGVYDDETASERVELLVERDDEEPVPDAVVRAAVKRAVVDRYQVTIARVHIVEPGWLVKTTSGKMSRSDNLARLAELPPQDHGHDDDSAADEPHDLEHVVLRTIATTFDVPIGELSRQTVATDVAGWDSLGHTVLLIRLSRALDATIPEGIASEAANVGELIDLVAPLAGEFT